jgi:hypothetical protein
MFDGLQSDATAPQSKDLTPLSTPIIVDESERYSFTERRRF